MTSRRATVRSFAKINLDLRVLHKRQDGYHELRTVFQTISLADRIEIEFIRAPLTEITLEGNVDIPDNLVVRAARAIFDHGRATGRLNFRLHKRIPMGAGLGGGSSNAAAVLLALPVLAGIAVDACALTKLAAELGSDVPFFLYGGTAVGIGRGTEIYPLPDGHPLRGVVIAPRLHVSTPEAYRGLGRALTTEGGDFDTGSFLALVWGLGAGCVTAEWRRRSINDFESSVFRQHPELLDIKKSLAQAGANPAMMSGSGSAVFGLFDSGDGAQRAARALAADLPGGAELFRISLVTRRQYQAAWIRQLGDHTIENVWPPQSRYLNE